ncbi:MAG: OB-fold nucleic acid binding domain-containing protein [Alistipes sp.]
MSISELSEQEQIRRNSLAELRKLGIEPYPAAKYEVTATAARIAAEYDPDKGNFQEVSIAGRIMSRRIMGSASFFELQDHTGRIQVYVKRDDICNGDPESTLYNKVFKNCSISATSSASGDSPSLRRPENCRCIAKNSRY